MSSKEPEDLSDVVRSMQGSDPGQLHPFATMQLPIDAMALAPDGSQVRGLLGLADGSMAHFELAAGHVARAVCHRTVEEIWYIVAGRGEMWRLQQDREEVVSLTPGVCLTIPLGTRFQFRADTSGPLSALAITMPPWPGAEEAVVVSGPWSPTVPLPDVESGSRGSTDR